MLNSSKEVIAYVGPFLFPDGGAAARRILGISQTIQALGYKVIIGSGQNHKGPIESINDIDVFSLNERTAESYPRLIKHLLYFSMGNKTVAWLESLAAKPKAIILYSGYSPYLLRLLPWCKKNKVQLIFDAVEWYDPPSLLKGILNPYYWNIELAMRFLLPKTKNIIAISKYLQNYYQLKKCKTVRIPPTLDVMSVTPRLDLLDSEVITLGYTGSPGHKDLLDNVLAALLKLETKGTRFRLNIAGITERQLLNYPSLRNKQLKTLPSCFKCYGVVSQPKAMEIIKKSDFSVLLRPNKRYAKAGFPTKFVESLTVGTPVIANFTSDLSDFLTDSENGIVCMNESESSLYAALVKASSLTKNELIEMRKYARQVAEKHFDVGVLKEQLNLFLERL